MTIVDMLALLARAGLLEEDKQKGGNATILVLSLTNLDGKIKMISKFRTVVIRLLTSG